MSQKKQSLGFSVRLYPFFYNGKKQGLVGSGIFFNGKEYFAIKDFTATYYIVGDGIIKKYKSKFGDFHNVLIEEVIEFSDSVVKSPKYKMYQNTCTFGFVPEVEDVETPPLYCELEIR